MRYACQDSLRTTVAAQIILCTSNKELLAGMILLGPLPVRSVQDSSVHLHCIADSRRPVRPPIPPIALLADCAAPLIAGPADDVTLDKP